MSDQEARAFVKGRGKAPKVLAELVRLDAFERVHDGYLIHDFEKYLAVGSRDRMRKLRDLKRSETAQFSDTNVTSQAGHDPRHRDVTSRAQVPVPVPVPDSPPRSPSSPPARDPELNRLLAGWYDMTGRQPNVDDDKAAATARVALHRFDVGTILELLRAKVEQRNEALKPVKSLAYFLVYLKREHDQLTESNGHRSGLTRLRDTPAFLTATASMEPEQ